MRNGITALILAAVAFTTIAVGGCASAAPKAERLSEITLGMSKAQVISILGKKGVARGAIQNRYSQVVEVYEYQLALPSDDSAGEVIGKTAGTLLTLGIMASEFKANTRPYWLYFVDGRLARWGEAGDWNTEPQRIYDVRFNPPPTPSNID